MSPQKSSSKEPIGEEQGGVANQPKTGNPADPHWLLKGWEDDELEVPGDFGQQLKAIAILCRKKRMIPWSELPQKQRDAFIKMLTGTLDNAVDMHAMEQRAANGHFDYHILLDTSEMEHVGFMPPSAKEICAMQYFDDLRQDYAEESFEVTAAPRSDAEGETAIDVTFSWANADLDQIKE